MPSPIILTTQPGADYELIDSGDGEKLERFSKVVLRRPDPQVLWAKTAPDVWTRAQAIFVGDKETGWQKSAAVPDHWTVSIGGLQLTAKLGGFKHTGIFPEQAPNWDWLRDVIKSAKRQVNVLNLFGYTGAASLACAQAGAAVCHVDGSKVAVTQARQNAELNGLAGKPIRWLLDDAGAFVKREVKRGRRYEGLIMDPPIFGHGPKGSIWKIEKDFVPLLDLCTQVLADKPVFILLNGYAAGYSALAYAANLARLTKKLAGRAEFGELTIQASQSPYLLPAGIFARWQSNT